MCSEYSESLFLKDIGLTEAKENDSKEMLQGPTLTNFKVHKEVAYKDAKYLGHQCSYQFKLKLSACKMCDKKRKKSLISSSMI